MKLSRRLIALLLAVLMLPVWVPTTAEAVTVITPGTSDSGVLSENVNPRYQGIFTADDFQVPEFPDTPRADAQINATYQTMSQAAVQMRSYLKNRTESFTISVTNSSSDIQTVAETIIANSMVHTGNPTEGDYLQWQWGRWDAQYTRTWTGSTYNYDFDFVFSYYTTAAQEAEMNTAVKNLISSLGLSGMSDYEKVYAVYDYICDNVTYDYDNLYVDSYKLKFSAYAALVNKTAVCQGYALLFYRLMLELGIDSRFIAGIGNGGAHGWNIVELDGLYYNVDSTWDAGSSYYNYFLVDTWTFWDHYRYLEYETWEFHETYPMAATAYDPDVAGEVDPYIYIDYCGDDAAFAVERDGTLTIAGTGATDDYSSDDALNGGAHWRYWDSNIKKLVVEEGITELGDYSFYNMANLKSVSLPDGLTAIGAYAFNNCTGITKITFPDSLESIGEKAFYNCDGLKSVTVPESVTSLDGYIFAACTNLTSADIRCAELSYGMFAFCEKLTDVNLSNNVSVLGDYAFTGCTALTEITIPGSVTSLDSMVFEDCTALKNVYFVGDMPEFGYYTFSGLTATAWYPADNDTWDESSLSNYSGVITWKAQKELKITQQPEDAYAIEGSRATVTVKAQGNDLTYKWYFKDAGASKFSLTTSFTGNKYYVTMNDVRDGRQVYCVITDAHGKSVTTDTVTLTLITKATILTEPKDTQVKLGATAKATVEAVGNGLTYQWYVKDVGGSSFTKSSNTTATYGYKMTEAKAGRQAYCIIKDADGNSAKTRTVTFGLAATIVTQPSNATAAEGKRATVTVKAVGDGLTYKWYYKDAGTSKFYLTTSFTGNKYYITMTDARAGRQVYCVITDQYGNKVTTKTVTLDYPATVKITAQPKDTQVNLGATAKATVTATGDGLTYQWYVKDVGGSSFSKSSNTTATYGYKMTEAKAGRQAYCIITDSSGNKVQTRTVTFGLKVTLVAQPEDVTVASGKKATVQLNVVGDGLTYKWYYKDAGTSKFYLTTSFTGNKYYITMTDARAGRQVYCVITDQYGNSVQTNTVTLNME